MDEDDEPVGVTIGEVVAGMRVGDVKMIRSGGQNYTLEVHGIYDWDLDWNG